MNIIVSNKDITKYHKCLSDLYWFGCYEGDSYFRQYFEPSTYAHPAKISPLLADRIFKHLEKLELLKEGMTILDFMSGSGRVPLLASLRGYKSIGVELEPHFVKMCNDNKKFAENKIGRKLDMTVVQGDSRQLSKLLGKSDIAVISPPYANPRATTQEYDDKYDLRRPEGVAWGREGFRGRYGDNKNNIGNLPYVGVVSPPYQDSITRNTPSGANDLMKHKWYVNENNQAGYSQNPENIGNLKDTGSIVGITSPPYVAANEGGGINKRLINKILTEKDKDAFGNRTFDITKGGGYQKELHSDNPQNIANLKDTSFVGITSPPYDNRLKGDNLSAVGQNVDINKQIENMRQKGFSEDEIKNNLFMCERGGHYSENQENIGNQNNESYLSAMLQVYKEASKVCPIIAVVTKNPTRAGKLRRLDLDTISLLQMAGYEIVDFHHAVLFQTNWQQTLDGKNKPEYKGRLSFFKRLSLQKGNRSEER